jgi:hypothetical protein
VSWGGVLVVLHEKRKTEKGKEEWRRRGGQTARVSSKADLGKTGGETGGIERLMLTGSSRSSCVDGGGRRKFWVLKFVI